jgi:hypothetical protein
MISWLLGIIAYFAYMLNLFAWPPDLLFVIGIAALVLGVISLATDRRSILLLGFALMLGGVVSTYGRAVNVGWIWIWVAAAAAQIFFGSLSLRE